MTPKPAPHDDFEPLVPCLREDIPERAGLTLMEACLLAPLVGMRAGEGLLHKVTTSGLPMKDWETAEFATAVCGASVKLIPGPYKSARVKGTGLGFCQPCRAGGVGIPQ